MRIVRIGSPPRPDIRQERKGVPELFPFRERKTRHAYLALWHQSSVLVPNFFLLDLKDPHLHGFPVGIEKFLQTTHVYNIRIKINIFIFMEFHNKISVFYIRTFTFLHFFFKKVLVE